MRRRLQRHTVVAMARSPVEYFVGACAYVLANAERVGIADWPWRGGEMLAELA